MDKVLIKKKRLFGPRRMCLFALKLFRRHYKHVPLEAARPVFILFFPSRNSLRQKFLVMHKCFPSDQKPGWTIFGFGFRGSCSR